MSRFALVCAVAAIVLALAPIDATAKVLWQSDFVNKGIEQFEVYDVGPQMNPEFIQRSGPSVWYVKNGALRQDSNIYGLPDPPNGIDNPYTGTNAVVKDFKAQDGIFFIQFRTGDNDGVSIVFRWQDEKNFMRFFSIIDPGNGGPITRLEKWTDGNFTILDSTTEVVYRQNVQETMLVIANGSQLEAYVADFTKPLLKGVDPDPKPGSFGVGLYAQTPMEISALKALSLDSNFYVATLKNKEGQPLSGYWSSLSSNGNPVAGIYTNPDGQAVFLDVPAGTYDISVAGLTTEPVAPQKATVKSGVNAETFSIDAKSTPVVAELSTAAGAKWKIKLPASPTDDYRDPAKSDADFADYEVPSNWDGIDPTDFIHGWLRVRVSVPPQYQGKELVLTRWTFFDWDWTYWNGEFIGHSTNYRSVRTYVIPGSLVKAENLLAIHGYNTTGRGGMVEYAPLLMVPNPSVKFTGTVTDQNGAPVEGVEVVAFAEKTAWGPQTGIGVTGPDGVYVISGLAPANYTVTRSTRLDLDPAEGQTVTKSGAAGETITVNFTVNRRPKMDLSSAAGINWLVMYPADPGDTRPAAASFDESTMVSVPVPGRLENFGLGDDRSLFWYRARFRLPDEFKAYKGRDLILTGFNLDDADVTYFNGQMVGSTGKLPTDPSDPGGTGYVGNAGGIRTYTVPSNIVNWDGENVLAINGYENTGSSGMTSASPVLIVAPGPAPAVVRGDLNGDGKVTVPDATLALRFAVGFDKPSPAQLQAGDINGNGKIDIPDATLILRAAVGLGKL